VSAEAVGGTPYLAGGLSEKGRRESNEDAAILAVLPPPSALKAFAVLSDGMGGHNAGEVASRLTVEILGRKIQAFAARPDAASKSPASIEAEIREWIDEVNREIFQRGKASSEQKGMGATVACALVLADDRLVVANVGDSKVFLASGLKVRQLSVDHTALAEHRRALGSDSVAPEDDAANPFAHALTRSLGQEKKVEPDVRSDVTLGPGDAVILTTDGVTDVLEAERFLTVLETSGSVQEAAEEIYRLAFEDGSKDNISVALLSRGTPARLGFARTGAAAAPVEPPPAPAADSMLVAGAASGPPGATEIRPRAGRRAAIGAAVLVLLAALAALVVTLRRAKTVQAPQPPSKPAASSPASAPPASAAPAVLSPAPVATPVAAPASPAPSPSPEPAPTAAPGREPRAQATPRPSAPRPPRATAEPSFRAPAAFSGLQPLEFPPTPTDTATPTHSPTPSATGTPTPVPTQAAPAGKAPGSPAPQPAPTPGVSA
jgi:protein phosphatase